MYRKILVTGGSGLLGTGLKAITSEFPEREFVFLSSKDCNLNNLTEVLDCFGKHKADAVLHFAALSGGIEYSTKYPATLLRDNVLMNLNVLEAARLLEIKKTALTLSTGMYPVDAPNPIVEDTIHNGQPHPTNYSYSFAKRLIDPSVRAYRTVRAKRHRPRGERDFRAEHEFQGRGDHHGGGTHPPLLREPG